MKKILVVDDNYSNRELLVDLLKRYSSKDVKTLIASNGTDALKTVQEQNPDLVLLDINMPEMDGVEVCQAIKSDPKTAKTYVVMVTANIDAEMRVEAKTVGADEYITKPFDVKQVCEIIEDVLKL